MITMTTATKHIVGLITARTNKGITQREMAERLGVKLRSYQRYEQGTRKLSLEKAIEISELLQIDIKNLSGRNYNANSEKKKSA
jgi:transcriptional regulator with XRE-family HTH domain